MVSAWCSSGALLLVMLTGASYSYPAKKGSKAPSPMASGSWAASTAAHQGPSYEEPRYAQPGVQREPAAASSANSFAAPAYSEDDGRLTQPYYQPTPKREVTWAIAPSLFVEAEPASAQGFALSEPVGPPAPPPGPTYQEGELAHVAEILEHGNSESETEEPGYASQQASYEAENAGGSFPVPMPFGYDLEWIPYPYYDYLFLTGQYPPGTLTHFSSSLEQGRDNWHDSHYLRYYYPASPSIQQEETVPVQHVKQPHQHVKPTVQGYGF